MLSNPFAAKKEEDTRRGPNVRDAMHKAERTQTGGIGQMFGSQVEHLPKFEKLGGELKRIERNYADKVNERTGIEQEMADLQTQWNTTDDQIVQHVESVYPDRTIVNKPKTKDEWKALCDELYKFVEEAEREDVRFEPAEIVDVRNPSANTEEQNYGTADHGTRTELDATSERPPSA